MKFPRAPLSLAKLLAAVMLSILLTGTVWAGKLFSKPINSHAGETPVALATGDFNKDGILDVAITGNTDRDPGQVRVLLGEGHGAFQKPVKYKAGHTPLAMAVGDIDGDGKLDLVVVNTSEPRVGNLSIFFGNGDGTFQPQVKRGDTKHTAINVVVGDFNADGKLDLALINVRTSRQPGFVSVLLGNGDGTFQAPIKTETSQNPASLAAGDVNGDGKLDLIVSDYQTGEKEGGTFVLLGNGDGTFQVSFLGRPGSKSIALGDFNGDEIRDFAEAGVEGKVVIQLGNGDGTFQEPRHFMAGGALGLVALSDFDGDGKLDVVVTAHKTGYVVEFLPGKGDGRLGSPTIYFLNSGAHIGQMITADVNNDGKPDLVLTDYSNRCVTVLLNRNR